MKKFKSFIIAVLLITAANANAQIATENQKFFDNIYVGIEGGVTTPLDFKNLFPVNSLAGVKIGKEITPVVGFEIEGQAFFNDNNFQRWTKTFVKGTNVTVSRTTNLMNLLCGYNGTPRTFEIKTNTGLGWMYFWDTNVNTLSAKTALDFNLNFGKTKAHTLFVSPGVYWDLHRTGKIQFNKNYAQFAVLAGYVYHFKTSNGTRHFKTYNVGDMSSKIKKLNLENGELTKKLSEVSDKLAAAEAVKPEVKVVKEVKYVTETHYVTFAKNSYELDNAAKAELDKVEGVVDIYGYASPEGTEAHNKVLSQKRADVVATYLRNRNVNVNDVIGMGVVGNTSNRIAIVRNAEIKQNVN